MQNETRRCIWESEITVLDDKNFENAKFGLQKLHKTIQLLLQNNLLIYSMNFIQAWDSSIP